MGIGANRVQGQLDVVHLVNSLEYSSLGFGSWRGGARRDRKREEDNLRGPASWRHVRCWNLRGHCDGKGGG